MLKSLFTPKIILDVPIYYQSSSSANCGPCSVKMILDYFRVTRENRIPYSLHSINRLLKTSNKDGVDEEFIEMLFKRVGLQHKIITPKHIIKELNNGNPILASFEDELEDGHYAVIVGAEYPESNNPMLIFQDPWPDMGQHFKRRLSEFKTQVQAVDGWLMAVHGPMRPLHLIK